MGEVWKARDTSLNRDVAIKALPDALAGDADRLARLEREAKLLAALNHPNIAAIHGLEVWGRSRVLVLELVEGLTVADRLVRGPISIDEALKLALQIAEALEAAHEKNIIHRDLKPANIKVTPVGRVKVLDFGLAKAVESASDDGLTYTGIPTEAGVVLGTPAYMSPEQARGEPVGRQTDIWAFGVVLYEMLTGLSLFRGPSTADTLAQVLGTQPDFSKLPLETPVAIRDVVRRCLEKDRRRRFQHMGDVRFEIEEALVGPRESAARSTPVITRRSRLQVASVIGTMLAVGLAGWLVGQRSAPRTPSGPVLLSIPFAEGPGSGPVGTHRLAISKDGSHVAYASSSRLWIRRMGDRDPASVGGSGGNPFFSPDGEWLGVFTGSELIKVPVGGGPPIVLSKATERSAGATWSADGTIAFATTEGLYQISQDGGEARLLLKPDRQRKERLYAWPQFMPDGRSLLVTVVPEGPVEGATVALLDLATRELKTVVKGGTSARYVPTGHLLYATGSTLKAVAFDISTGQTRGDAMSLPGIEVWTSGDNGAANFAVSESGTLVYLTPSIQSDLRTLSWMDRQGREEPLPIRPGAYLYPRVSPDGTRVALDVRTAGRRDIWILNLGRLSLTQLTDGPTEDMTPMWAPDGRRVFFASDRTGNFDVYSQAADGASGAKVEFAGPGMHTPSSFTPDGSRLLVFEQFRDTGLLNLAKPDRLEPLLHSEFDERIVQVSPDGNWILYESNESGDRFEVFVRPFPNVSARREQVSIDGGRYPHWGRKGTNELFYVTLAGEMMAVSVTLSPTFTLGRATKLFQREKPPAGVTGLPYDISPVDGRFLVTKPVAERATELSHVSVVLNFLEDLNDRIPRQ